MNLNDLISKTKLNIAQLKEPKKDREKTEMTPDRWVPDIGTSILRFLTSDEDYDADKDMWFRKFNVHFLNKRVFLCPKEKGYKCPSCDHGWSEYNRLKESNAKLDNDKKDRSYSTFLPSQRCVVKVILKKFSSDGGVNFVDIEAMEKEQFGYPQVKLLDLSNSYVEEINKKYVFNHEYGDITHLTEGFDFTLVREQKKKGEASAQRTMSFTPARLNSPVFSKHVIPRDNEELFVTSFLEMMEKSPRIVERFDELTNKEILEMLDGHFHGMPNAEAESEKFGGEVREDKDDFTPGKNSAFAATAAKFNLNGG